MRKIAIILASFAVAACGSDQDTQSRLVVLLTDAPGAFEKVPIEIEGLQAMYMGAEVQNRAQYQQAAAQGESGELQLQNQVQEQSGAKQGEGEGEGQWVRLMTQTQQQDLLQLRDGKTAGLGDAEISGGFYNRLRIKLSKAQVTVDGQTHDLGVPAEGIELAFKFELKAGAGHEMVIDFDAEQSIQKKAEGEGYELHPYIGVKQFRYTHRYANCNGENDCTGGETAQPQPGDCKEGSCQPGPQQGQ